MLLAIEFDEEVEYQTAIRSVEVAGGFVGQEDRWLGHEGTGEGDALLLSAAQLNGIVGRAVEQTDLIEKLTGAWHAVARLPGQLMREQYVFFCCKRGDELVALEHKADFGPAHARHVVFRKVGDVHAVQEDAARRWRVQTGEKAQQSALAATGGTHDGDEFSMRNCEADPLKNLYQVRSGLNFAGDRVDFDGKRIRHEYLLFSILTVVTRFSFFFLIFVSTLVLGGCAQKSAEPEVKMEVPAPMAALPPEDLRPVVLCFGDSITAGLGLEAGKTYPDVLQGLLDDKGYKYRVVNSGISGDTTQAGMDRLPDALRYSPKVTILELGGNDGLRGIPVHRTRDTLTQIAGRFEAKGSKILLLGITLPRNYGPDYIHEFEAMYKGLATNHRYALMPFVLEGVWDFPGAMQADKIHPTTAGAAMVAKNVFRYLEPLLER